MLCLGKKDPAPEAFKLAFENYAIAEGLPTPPKVFGDAFIFDPSEATGVRWSDLGNLQCGDCVFAGFFHQITLWKILARQSFRYPVPQDVIQSYSACTGYVANDPTTDQGTAVADGCAYWMKTGLSNGADIDMLQGFVSSKFDPDSIALAAYLFGSVGVGLQLPEYALDQFMGHMPWTFSATANAAIAGGHYVPIIGRNSHGFFLCVSWGRLQAIDPQFLVQYADEAVICLSKDWVGTTSQKSPRGVDYAKLTADLPLLRAN